MNRYPELKEVMRRAEITGTPPLDDSIRDKLVQAFTDICYRRDLILEDGFNKACRKRLDEYKVLTEKKEKKEKRKK